MRRPLFFLSLALLGGLALSAAAQAAAPPARDSGAPDSAQAAAQAIAEKPGTVETLKRALQAQGEVSPQTMEALKGTPMGAQPAGQGDKAQGSGGTPGQPGRKAIYGDIIIHK